MSEKKFCMKSKTELDEIRKQQASKKSRMNETNNSWEQLEPGYFPRTGNSIMAQFDTDKSWEKIQAIIFQNKGNGLKFGYEVTLQSVSHGTKDTYTGESDYANEIVSLCIDSITSMSNDLGLELGDVKPSIKDIKYLKDENGGSLPESYSVNEDEKYLSEEVSLEDFKKRFGSYTLEHSSNPFSKDDDINIYEGRKHIGQYSVADRELAIYENYKGTKTMKRKMNEISDKSIELVREKRKGNFLAAKDKEDKAFREYSSRRIHNSELSSNGADEDDTEWQDARAEYKKADDKLTRFARLSRNRRFRQNKSESKINESLKLISTLDDYRPWSGAVDTYEKISDAGLLDQLESILEDSYPDGLTMSELNDLLWFESKTVLDWLGLREYDGNIKEGDIVKYEAIDDDEPVDYEVITEPEWDDNEEAWCVDLQRVSDAQVEYLVNVDSFE